MKLESLQKIHEEGNTIQRTPFLNWKEFFPCSHLQVKGQNVCKGFQNEIAEKKELLRNLGMTGMKEFWKRKGKRFKQKHRTTDLKKDLK